MIPALPELLQRIERGRERLPLVHPREHFVIARLDAHIDDRQAKRGQLLKLVHGLVAHVARQAIARHAPHGGQLAADGLKHGHEAARGKRHRVAVGQENPPDLAAKRGGAALDALQHLLLGARPEALLRRGVHFAEGAAIPGAAVGQRQDQQFRLARRPEDGFDIADGGRVHGIAVAVSINLVEVSQTPPLSARIEFPPGKMKSA